jgi:hypothetical protein
MPYFDTTTDVTYLPGDIRDYAELADVGARAEALVIEAYTISTHLDDRAWDVGFVPFRDAIVPVGAVDLGDGRAVCLRGYAVDAAEATAGLAAAMKREIADAIRWNLSQWRKKPLVTSQSTKGESVSYRDDAEVRLPPGFGFWLRHFDVRPKPQVI